MFHNSMIKYISLGNPRLLCYNDSIFQRNALSIRNEATIIYTILPQYNRAAEY